MTPEQIFEELDDLARGGGYVDDAALRRFKSLTMQLRMLPGAGTYFCEKLNAAESYAEILYSTKKHQRYGDAQEVRVLIISDLAAARRNLSSASPSHLSR